MLASVTCKLLLSVLFSKDFRRLRNMLLLFGYYTFDARSSKVNTICKLKQLAEVLLGTSLSVGLTVR